MLQNENLWKQEFPNSRSGQTKGQTLATSRRAVPSPRPFRCSFAPSLPRPSGLPGLGPRQL